MPGSGVSIFKHCGSLPLLLHGQGAQQGECAGIGLLGLQSGPQQLGPMLGFPHVQRVGSEALEERFQYGKVAR